jgi:hypothetical protein
MANKTYQSNKVAIWRRMLAKCNNPADAMYFSFGGRGVKVCDRWYDFGNFLADVGDAPHGWSLILSEFF